ncbi:MAG TPA: anhydro-N-acetylmuramic acid kinase [Clostridiales bacterium]|nr:anhydro-N-acetylmuramic acid kinase [Clostridiales bacterium]HCI63705.1 anhydro-N-acetylmuramic acid kinase [Clostridiales bacterium]
MNPILECMEKESRLVVGLMSGTSADGVDGALCRITGHGTQSKIEQLGFVFQPFAPEIRREILRLASGGQATAADFCQMNFLLGGLYVQSVEALCARTGVQPGQIDLIGSHGQTFWHIPVPEDYLGYRFRSTFQLGEASVLAQRFGCPVVSDFRVRDVAADGLGAPLVPYSEFLIYRSETECVALQNIGGIGNITCLSPACRLEDVFAFDTGPGNMVMDGVYGELTDGEKTFDEGGAYAAGGTVHQGLLNWLMADPYLPRKPPKTTGREYYGPAYVKKIMDYARQARISGPDLMATVTDYTAQTIRYSVEHYFPRRPDKLILGGGGSLNKTLVGDIAKALPGCRVMTNEDLGYDSNAKEAVAFAVLANEAVFAQANNVPTVTGAKNPVIMGKISL